MFAANVVRISEQQGRQFRFLINRSSVGTGYVDVDIDISITHPTSGMPEYNGYDVRGIFIGNGSKTLTYGGNKLKYASRDKGALVDQQMYDYNLTTGDPIPV